MWNMSNNTTVNNTDIQYNNTIKYFYRITCQNPKLNYNSQNLLMLFIQYYTTKYDNPILAQIWG